MAEKQSLFIYANGARNGKFLSSSSHFVEPASYMSKGDFTFTPPPDAPTYYPTFREFLDPLHYIEKIRETAEKYGIIKIIPPYDWNPEFSVDVKMVKFAPRVQRVMELNALTRMRWSFLNRLKAFWNYKKITPNKHPIIDGKPVDLYSLYKIVDLEGGYGNVDSKKNWTKVASRMGYVHAKVAGNSLREHYRKLLVEYEAFERLELRRREALKVESESPSTSGECVEQVKQEENETQIQHPVKEEEKPLRRCTRSSGDRKNPEILISRTLKNPETSTKNKELQRLTFFCPGPKILGSARKAGSLGLIDTSPYSYTCVLCNKVSEDNTVQCELCNDCYHTHCLPSLNISAGKVDWQCSKCIAEIINEPKEAYGFEQLSREYTLAEFGKMADKLKNDHFGIGTKNVPLKQVEQEYWRISSSLDSDVTVLYGADLHTLDFGSGFPTTAMLNETGDDYSYYKEYADSGWNLNNIPVLEGSVLGYTNADMSGMKIPWMYVGMCFSSFCWHNEDHWTYSINYLHWGDTKTWYGVPGDEAEKLEQLLQEIVPELFYNQPDLLHHLVTTMNPNVLMDRGLTVHRIDQNVGEFVVTFPRAYHCGFNHGFNLAEAVNFAPADWIPMGRACVDHYSNVRRYCVFSHDEVICKMAVKPDNLSSRLAKALYTDVKEMLNREKEARKELLKWRVTESEHFIFDDKRDDERKCCVCNTTCFLSAVKCKCRSNKITCLRHFKDLCRVCRPQDHTLLYHFTIDELICMMCFLKAKRHSHQVWKKKVKRALDITGPRTVTLFTLIELFNEGKSRNYVDDELYHALTVAIRGIEGALTVKVKDVLEGKTGVRKENLLEEAEKYFNKIKMLPSTLPQEHWVRQYLGQVFIARRKVKTFLSTGRLEMHVNELKKIADKEFFINLKEEDIRALKERVAKELLSP